ncbi:cell division control protein 6 homolog [Neosynchiropus ocellatus]
MPSTRSRGPVQPTLAFPRRRSARPTSRSKTPAPEPSPTRTPTKPEQRTVPVLLSPRRAQHLEKTSLSPRKHPVLSPQSRPGSPARLPLSPRKRSNDNNCNVQGSPPKQSKPSLASPRKLGFDENSPALARRQLVPPSPRLQPLSPTRASPRQQKAVAGSPARRTAERKRLFAEKSRFHGVKQALHTAVPERLLAREGERETIRCFLRDTVSERRPGSLYISGAPGTGKTACFNCVLKEMEAELASAVTVVINCMSLRSSHSVFALLADRLGVTGGQSGVQKLLTSSGPSVLLVLDELDQLDSRTQDVLYTLFEWPYLPESRLRLVGIANALDLTDRILPRLQARPHCRPLLLNFPPYSRQELAAIVQDRLLQASSEGVLDASAVQFCARKVSAVSGDARKALDICRRAVEIVESDQRKRSSEGAESAADVRVSLPQVARVLNEVYGDRMAAQGGGADGESFPLQQKLLVCCLLLLIRNGKSKEVPLGKLHEVHSRLCAQRQVGGVSQSECLALSALLESRGIFALKKSREARQTKVFLKIEERDVENALKDRALLGSILAAGLP